MYHKLKIVTNRYCTEMLFCRQIPQTWTPVKRLIIAMEFWVLSQQDLFFIPTASRKLSKTAGVPEPPEPFRTVPYKAFFFRYNHSFTFKVNYAWKKNHFWLVNHHKNTSTPHTRLTNFDFRAGQTELRTGSVYAEFLFSQCMGSPDEALSSC